MKTNIQGYYNGNDWPIMLCISERNLTLQLGPGQHVVDNGGHKINDPILERYVSKNGLSREVVTFQGDVVPLPMPAPSAVTIESKARSSPVLHATTFKTDKSGQLVPVFAAPPAPPAPAPQGTPGLMTVNQPGSPVRAFTMDEANKLGLVGKIKPLSEDYGATDTGTGVPAPGNQIPELRIPMEARRVPPKPLPPELTQVDERVTPAQAAMARSLQTSLNQAAQSNPDTLPTRPAPAPVAPEPVPLTTPTVPLITEAEAASEPAPAPVRRTASPLASIARKPLPQPDMPGITPDPQEEPPAGAPTSAKQITSKAFLCPLCTHAPFVDRGWLTRHANKVHPGRLEEVLAAYPLV